MPACVGFLRQESSIFLPHIHWIIIFETPSVILDRAQHSPSETLCSANAFSNFSLNWSFNVSNRFPRILGPVKNFTISRSEWQVISYWYCFEDEAARSFSLYQLRLLWDLLPDEITQSSSLNASKSTCYCWLLAQEPEYAVLLSWSTLPLLFSVAFFPSLLFKSSLCSVVISASISRIRPLCHSKLIHLCQFETPPV